MKIEKGFKNEYKTLAELVNAVPDDLYIRKKKVGKNLIIFSVLWYLGGKEKTCPHKRKKDN